MIGEHGDMPQAQAAGLASSPLDLVEECYIPQRYEPNYAYPLLVLFHDRGEDERRMIQTMETLSKRNHIGLSLRGSHEAIRHGKAEGYSWGPAFRRPHDSVNTVGDDPNGAKRSDAEEFRRQFEDPHSDPLNKLEDQVTASVRRIMRMLHVHSERVFLVGRGEGAAAAFSLGLRRPDLFAGIVSLNGWAPKSVRLLAHYHECRNLRVFMGHGLWNEKTAWRDAVRQARVFHNAGARVTFESYPTTHQFMPRMLSDVDCWLIQECIGGAPALSEE